jgi:hypothetical protein
LVSHRPWQRSVYQTTTLLAVVVLLLIVFISAAYVFLLPAPDPLADQEQVLAEFQEIHEKWSDRRPISYRYVVERTCFCTRAALEPYIATEKRGLKTAAFAVPFASETGALGSPPYPMWIDDLFTLMEQSASDGDRVLVEYDPRYGFPRVIDIEREAADAHDHYEIRDFEILEYR